MSLQLFLLAYSFVFGLVVGSFLNVCIARIPEGKSLGGRSLCPSCKSQILWYHNIPLFSYVALGGKCSFCKEGISFRYPLVELITAIFSVFTFWFHQYQAVPYFIWFILFICPLIVIAFIDAAHRIIPDVITLPGLFVGTGVMVFITWPLWQSALYASFMGILVGGGSLLLLGLAYHWIRNREGMGGGDVKLSAMLGAFLGWKAIIFIFLISSVLAIFYAIGVMLTSRSKKDSVVIPYGPFLAMAGIIYYFYGTPIFQFYFHWVRGHA